MPRRFLTFLFLFCAFSSAALAYSDVEESHPYADPIDTLTEEGVIQGYSDGTYRPEQEINRAEFLKIVMASRNPGYTPPGIVYFDSCFPDVDWQAWYSYYICAAKENGFVQGYPDGNYQPESVINMAEALKISIGAYNYPIEETEVWFDGVIDQAEALGLLPESYESPSQWVTRGEMAEIIARLMVLGDYDFSNDVEEPEEPEEEDPEYEQEPPVVVDASGEELDALEEEFLDLLNDYRADLGLDPLEDDLNLNLAARSHTEWMYETGIYEHQGENGSYMTDRCIAAGTYCYGEILLHYYNDDAQEFLEAWQGSSAHDAVITRWYYTRVGISFYGGYATVVFSFDYDPNVDYGW